MCDEVLTENNYNQFGEVRLALFYTMCTTVYCTNHNLQHQGKILIGGNFIIINFLMYYHSSLCGIKLNAFLYANRFCLHRKPNRQ